MNDTKMVKKVKKLIVKNGANRTGVGAWCKERIVHHYETETELDTDKLAEEARKKFGGKTNKRCVQWYINDLKKDGTIQ